MTELKQFTLEEVSQHNNRESPYLIIHDKVYDVKKFLDEHPGGEEVLIEESGKDSTESFEDVGHSTDAKDLMAQYLVGEIVEHQRSKKETKSRKFEELPPENLESSGWKQWSVMIGLAIISVIVYRTYY